MSKDFKEKYEKVCGIKDKALTLVETQMNGDIANVDAEELGEVMDIAKDCAELMMYCAQGEYYHKVVEAMEEGSDEEKSYYLNKYMPEYDGKFYTPMNMARARDSRGRYMYTEPYMYRDEPNWDRSRMYYTNPGSMTNTGNNSGMSSNYTRDMREGRSGMMRKTYMEMKESGHDGTKELEDYMTELSGDITEMIKDMTPAEKTTMKQKLSTLVTKIV